MCMCECMRAHACVSVRDAHGGCFCVHFPGGSEGPALVLLSQEASLWVMGWGAGSRELGGHLFSPESQISEAGCAGGGQFPRCS